MVAFRIVAEERQAEAVLAAGGAVTAADIAAGPHENRHDVEFEADGTIGLGVRDLHRRGRGLTAEVCLQLGAAVGDRVDDILVQADKRGIG